MKPFLSNTDVQYDDILLYRNTHFRGIIRIAIQHYIYLADGFIQSKGIKANSTTQTYVMSRNSLSISVSEFPLNTQLPFHYLTLLL